MFHIDQGEAGLFDVQREAVKRARGKQGFAFFLEQGLGKTLTVLWEFHTYVTERRCSVLFVICPPDLRGNWQDEARECGFPYASLILETEKKALATIATLGNNPVMVFLNYELYLTRGRKLLDAILAMKRGVYIALDESVRVKKHDSVIGERIYFDAWGKERVAVGVPQLGKKQKFLIQKVRDPVRFVRVLSGTPNPQGPHDLWNQFRIIGLMENTLYFSFRSTYCRMGGYMGKSIMGSQNLDVLRMRTGSNVFRAKKLEWASHLPEKIWMRPREVQLEPEQRRAYREILNDYVIEFGPDDFVTAQMQITVKGKLQQIASGWVYDNEGQVRELVPVNRNPKLQVVRQMVEEIEGKILVVYYFRPTRDYLAKLAEEIGVGHVFLESGLKREEFDARKARFNGDDSIKVAFCQVSAVKEGHTLLGTKDMPCHTTLFMENSYDLYARKQMEDRNHRHGQVYPVTYNDISTSPEDKAIIKSLQRKEGVMEAILGEFSAFRAAT